MSLKSAFIKSFLSHIHFNKGKMFCQWFPGKLLMVSNSTDINPTPEEIKPSDHMISSQARGQFLFDF